MSEASLTRPSAVVRLSNVELALAGTKILSGLNLTLSERRVGIVGRNGSGKSTLARVMTGLIAADSGENRFRATTIV